MKKIKVKCKAATTIDYRLLKPFQGELKELDDNDRAKLKETIRDRGFAFPIFVWEDASGTPYTMDGHQRCKILAELEKDGYEIPPVPISYILADDLEDAKHLLLHGISQYGRITKEGLLGYIHDAGIPVDALADFRMPDIDLDDLIDSAKIPEEPIPEDIDQVPDVPSVATSKRGKIYVLGRHRLMCGDSTDPKDVAMLMNGKKARMVYTDPPYGVSYKGTNNPNGREWTEIENDDLRGDELYAFLEKAFKNMAESTIENPAAYVFHASSNQVIFEKALIEAGFKIKQQIIWNKGMILGHSDYHWAHEPIFYCAKQEKNCEWFGDRTQKTLQGLKIGDLAEIKKEILVELLEQIMMSTTNWEFRRDHVVEYVHPTQKPVAMAARAIRNSSDKGEIVLDLFGGSG